MKRGRGQYSLEFLITYGWALLIIGIIIAVIYSFGWLDSSNFLPQKCVFYGQVGCKDFYVTDNSINLSLVNIFGTDLYIKGMTFRVNNKEIVHNYSWSASDGNLIMWNKSSFAIVSLSLPDSDLIKKGSRIDGVVVVHFFSNITCGGCFDHAVGTSSCDWDCLHNSSGKLLAKVSK